MAIPKIPLLRSEAPPPGNRNTEILSGWKDIAQYMDKGVRTVQRYECEMRLPIRRLGGAKGSVIASKSDLIGWLLDSRARVHSMSDLTPLAHRANKTKADFLRINSHIALTFSGIALAEGDPSEKERRTQTARKAYDTIMRLKHDVYLSDLETNNLDVNMARLKSELRRLGENF